VGLSGYVGAEAQDGLLEILAARRLQQQMLQQAEQAKAAQELDRQSLKLRQREGEEERTLRKQQMFQQQEQFDTTRRERRNIEGLQQMNIDRETWERENAPPPPPKLTRITTIGKRGEPVSKGVTDAELAAGVPEYVAPKADPPPKNPQYIQVTGPDGQLRLLTPDEIRSQGGVQTDKGNAPNPQKAEEVRSKIADLAGRLQAHPGRKALTGSRVLNPSYALGWNDEPVGGTQAAGAGSLLTSLKAVMTLENLGLLKGVLSDRDIQMLQAAASALDSRAPDADFERELQGIIAKVGQSPATGGNAQTQGQTPQVGDVKTFPNGRKGRFDGKGWVQVP
jgi:hypothetical protein